MHGNCVSALWTERDYLLQLCLLKINHKLNFKKYHDADHDQKEATDAFSPPEYNIYWLLVTVVDNYFIYGNIRHVTFVFSSFDGLGCKAGCWL